MGRIITCIDGSTYADSVCNLSAWAAKANDLDIALLHVVAPHYDAVAKSDLSGQIGLGAKSGLLKELTEIDEARGKMEQRKGQLMLKHAKEELLTKGVKNPEMLHRRGSLVETIADLDQDSEISMVVMGKRGEYTDMAPDHLGSNLERVARAIHKPLLVTTDNASKVIKGFLIAYDGSFSSEKAVEYAINNPLLKNLECHLLMVGEENELRGSLDQTAEKLESSGFAVHKVIKQGVVYEQITNYISENSIDLLVIGAYGHSKLRSLILGSLTRKLINKTNIPVLLFR